MLIENDFIQQICIHLEKLESLIREENTGNAVELAQKAGITSSQVLSFIHFMKEACGELIWYDNERNTYYYVTNYSES
ncbi:hypothetical protein HB364_32565 [Pseudoflavitalea sp. X16]|uniref:hypothetical protein n=1 Tax=Paraflavitalea devenefica TaxID=2716334 RepID=UPI001422F412|nr:hypothetical protein [Paraflavitalea devenefica]NII29857.1 hypothetical protein [Paraflavitalea devenefica]